MIFAVNSRKKYQKTGKLIAYQGEPGAFSELAARRAFGNNVSLLPCVSFAGVFEAVRRGRARAGVVPVENTVFGPIHETRDLLARHRLAPIGEVTLRVRLCVLGLPGATMRSIRVIRSQPQALGQCGNFLGHLRQVRIEPAYDTAAAARLVGTENDPSVACVAGRQAAAPYGLRVLKEGVEDDVRNFTRFLMVGRSSELVMRSRRRGATTLAVVSLPNTPGSLHRLLGVFAAEGIDLRAITSRPQPGRPWEYVFHVDLAGSTEEPRLRRALNAARSVCILVRVLGCHARGRTYQR